MENNNKKLIVLQVVLVHSNFHSIVRSKRGWLVGEVCAHQYIALQMW